MTNEIMPGASGSPEPVPPVTPTTASPPPSPAPVQARPGGCLSELGWLGAGWVLACFSPTFYYRAARRRVGSAILFFVMFGLVITSLQTLSLIRGFAQAGIEIRRAFEAGDFPEITLSGGVAEVSGPQPRILIDDPQSLVVLDTTGQYTEIDRRRYASGFLLTRTTLIVLNQQGQYQEVPLSQLQQVLNADPIVINGETATNYWTIFAVIFSVIALVFLAVWNTLVRIAYLAVIALVFWGIAALIRPGTGFGPVLVAGLYALVPAEYARFLLSEVRFGFLGLFTIFLLPLWAAALAAALIPRAPAPASDSIADYFRAEHSPRLWRALIALPLLADFALESIFDWKAWYVTWPLAFLTLIALLAVSLWPLLTKKNAPTQTG